MQFAFNKSRGDLKKMAICRVCPHKKQVAGEKQWNMKYKEYQIIHKPLSVSLFLQHPEGM